MFRRDDAGSVSGTGQAGDTGSALPVTSDSTSTPSPVLVPSSTGRGLVVVETSTPPESYTFSTLQPSIPSFTIASSIYPVAPTPTPAGSTSAYIPSTSLFYSIVSSNPIPTIAPVSISIPPLPIPVSDTPAPSPSSTWADGAFPFPLTSLFYSIVTAAEPSVAPLFSILPVSVSVSGIGILPTSSSTSADFAPGPESGSLFYSIVTAGDPVPASLAPAAIPVYSILPVSDITTIPTSSGYASADTNIPLSTSPFYSIATVADPTSTPTASILPISDTRTIPTSPSSILRVSESTTLGPLINSILPATDSTPVYSILLTSDAPAVPTSALTHPGITPTGTPGPSKSTSNNRIVITTEDTPAQDAYHGHSTSSTNLSPASEAPTTSTSSQRINNLALQPTADGGVSSTVLITSGSITRTFVVPVPPTGGITGVGGDTPSGPGSGPSSGDTPSHHAPPIPQILGPVLAGVILVSFILVIVGVRWRNGRRRRREARWQRLPYEPALDTSRHSSRYLNPFEDIDDDWSIIASELEVERPVSTTTTGSALVFAPSREAEPMSYTTRFGVSRPGGWR